MIKFVANVFNAFTLHRLAKAKIETAVLVVMFLSRIFAHLNFRSVMLY